MNKYSQDNLGSSKVGDSFLRNGLVPLLVCWTVPVDFHDRMEVQVMEEDLSNGEKKAEVVAAIFDFLIIYKSLSTLAEAFLKPTQF